VAGNCVDMPSVPPDQDFKQKVKAKAEAAHPPQPQPLRA
jgi:hypothetical protein